MVYPVTGSCLSEGTPLPPPCPGATWFEVLAAAWHDQSLMRQHQEGLHHLELARAARPPVLAVTVVSPSETGPLAYTVDPVTRTVSVDMTGPQRVIET